MYICGPLWIPTDKEELVLKNASDGECEDFLHKPIVGSLTWTAFPRGWVPLDPLERCLKKKQKVRS